MNLIPWLNSCVLIAAAYFSALASAMDKLSPSALEQRLEETGRSERARWLFDRESSVRHAVALLRTALRLTFFTLVLVQYAKIDGQTPLAVMDLVIAGLIALGILWLFTSVLATAMARYASTGLIASALPMLRGLSLICLPLTHAFSFVDEVVKRLSGANLRELEEEAEAELLRSIEDTHREGALDEKAAALLENVVEFSSTDVGEVMTPRTDIDGIELTNDLATVRAFILKVGHSRIPVFEENLDHIAGILYVKDLVQYLGTDASDLDLKSILRQPIVVPETKPVRELLTDFQRSEIHMAMVIDEYGGTAGLVTIEAVLEEIAGEMHDEHEPEDEAEPALHRIDGIRAETDGRYHIDDLNEELGLDLPEDDEYDTIAGFVLASLGHVPVKGEAFESHSARFTTLAATPTHIQRVGITLLDPAATNGHRQRKSNGS